MVWYDIKIQVVNKLMQSSIMHMVTTLCLLRKTKKELKDRVSGFVGAQILAKKMCEADLKEKGLRKTKRQFSYESPDE